MQPIDGIHHITLITGDAPRNVDFYARVLGLRMVKKTVNQDDPSVYHLFYSDEHGSPGADITFFEYPGAQPGQAGAGMVSSIAHRVGGEAALDFWSERLAGEGVEVAREPGRLRFADPEGMQPRLVIDQTDDAPLTARSSERPAGVRAAGLRERPRARRRSRRAARRCCATRSASPSWPSTIGWRAASTAAGGSSSSRASARGVPGAGTVHHVAWSVDRAEQEQWRERVIEGGPHPTPIIDRFYFESVYFREPGGILYELATRDGKGFAADEPPEDLGEKLALPPRLEPLREQIEPHLTALPDTSQWRPTE